MTEAGEVPRRGRYLALDWGSRRIGVAATDPDRLLAFPVTTVDAADPWSELKELLAEYEPVAVIVGYPVTLAGTPGPAAENVALQAERLAGLTEVPVRLVDERLTTAESARKLHEAGRTARQQRQIVDQQAAVAILETVLASER
jgi:putative Holliday junction resolvase